MEPLRKYAKAFAAKQAKVGGAVAVIGRSGLSRAGLVAVEREVNRGGKTHRQIYWVHPGDKEPGDKQIGGGETESAPVEFHDHVGPGVAKATSQAAAQYLSIESEPWKAKLTSVERTTVVDYTGHGYTGVNNFLRKGEVTPGVSQELLHSKVHDMDGAVYKGTVSADTTVWRGVGQEVGQTLKPGMKFKDNGFVSTSLMAREAAEFSVGGAPADKTMIRIKIPKGAHAALPDGISNIPEEVEVILPRSTEFKIVSESIVTLGFKSFRVLEAEVVRQPKRPPPIKAPKQPKPKEDTSLAHITVGTKVKLPSLGGEGTVNKDHGDGWVDVKFPDGHSSMVLKSLLKGLVI